MTDQLTLDIESIAAGGDGVARHDRLVVFVPRTAPGDRVVAQVERSRRFARGRIERIERAAAGRVTPQCGHYDADRCGGCQLQHLSVAAQQEAKRGIIRDTVRRLGRRTIEPPPIHGGDSPWRYRRRLSLALRRRADGSWFAGMHAWDDPSLVFDLRDCLITNAHVMTLWREVVEAGELLPDATVLRGTVRLVGDRGAFILEGGMAWPNADAFVARLASFDHAWWVPQGGRRRRVGPVQGIGGPHASFSQVNPEVAAHLTAFVEARVVALAPAHVIDAYAGAGDLAASLHARGIRVTAVELDEDAGSHSATRLHRPSRSVIARVEDVVGALLPADVVVLNPPRAGVDERVTAAIEGAVPALRAVIYVSCDPATLARDLARMPSWQISDVTAFDMFPQTAHVETVVELTRAAAA